MSDHSASNVDPIKTCEVCETVLVYKLMDDSEVEFIAHDEQFCKDSARYLIGSLKTQIQCAKDQLVRGEHRLIMLMKQIRRDKEEDGCNLEKCTSSPFAQLLRKYIKHVVVHEGIDFLDYLDTDLEDSDPEDVIFTEEEVICLRLLGGRDS